MNLHISPGNGGALLPTQNVLIYSRISLVDGLALMTKIVDKRTVDLDLGTFRDSYRDRIEALITSKLKGEAVQVEERKPKKSVAKSMMEALRKTEESLK
jgi:non-homologous end joining protein Ku